MTRVVAGRHVERGGHLRIAAGEIEDRAVALYGELECEAAREPTDDILVGEIGKPIVAVGDAGEYLARLMLGIIEQPRKPLLEGFAAELVDHGAHLALAGLKRADQRLEVAEVLVRLAHIEHHDAQHFLVQFATPVKLRRRKADALLVHLGQRPRQACRHRAAHVGIVDVSAGPADDLAVVEDRLPQVQVGRVGSEEPAVGIVGKGDVFRFVVRDHGHGAGVADARIPGGAEIHRHRDRRACRIEQHHGEVLRLLHERRVRGAVQRVGHVFGRRPRVVSHQLQRNLVEGHGCHRPAASVRCRLPK